MDVLNFRSRWRSTLFLVFALVLSVLFWAPSRAVWADGNHADAIPLGGGLSQLTFRGFRLELLTSAVPLRAGEKNKVILKIQRLATLEPVKDANVLMAITPRENPDTQSSGFRQNNQDQFIPAIEDVWAGNYARVHSLSGKVIIQSK